MKMKLLLRVILAIAGFAGYATASHACSVVYGYKVPTSIELAASADTIILARAIEQLPSKNNYDLGEIKLAPENLISGSILPSDITIRVYFENDRIRSTNSNENELAKANPDAFRGGCNRYVFRKGMLLLLFLKRDENGDWSIISAPFARTQEDVPDKHAPWVRAVTFYASVARLPKDERKQRLIAERDRLLATGDPIDALLARDIRRQLKGKRTQNYD
jgi:hypothetical protein